MIDLHIIYLIIIFNNISQKKKTGNGSSTCSLEVQLPTKSTIEWSKEYPSDTPGLVIKIFNFNTNSQLSLQMNVLHIERKIHST